MLTFLKLVAAHFIGDFILQPKRMAAGKRAPWWMVAHAAVHCALYAAALAPRPFGELLPAAALLASVHALIDIGKGRYFNDGALIFCVDQVAHLFSIVALASILPTTPLRIWSLVIQLVESPLVYLYIAGYIAIVLGASHLVQRISTQFLERIDQTVLALKPGLPEAGKYIGWLERSLIVTFLITDHAEIIGFLVGAKAVIRYPEVKADDKGHLADYFLIGTLTSVGFALAGGLILVRLGRLVRQY